MADEERPTNSGSKDPLEELGGAVKEKLATGKFVFDNLVMPKAKEVLGNVRAAAEGQLKKVRDSLDPTRGLAENAVEARNWLIGKGLSLKRANEVVVETVAKAVKDSKPGTKEEKKNA